MYLFPCLHVARALGTFASSCGMTSKQNPHWSGLCKYPYWGMLVSSIEILCSKFVKGIFLHQSHHARAVH